MMTTREDYNTWHEALIHYLTRQVSTPRDPEQLVFNPKETRKLIPNLATLLDQLENLNLLQGYSDFKYSIRQEVPELKKVLHIYGVVNYFDTIITPKYMVKISLIKEVPP